MDNTTLTKWTWALLPLVSMWALIYFWASYLPTSSVLTWWGIPLLLTSIVFWVITLMFALAKMKINHSDTPN